MSMEESIKDYFRVWLNNLSTVVSKTMIGYSGQMCNSELSVETVFLHDYIKITRCF